jgi:hypothetical protein
MVDCCSDMFHSNTQSVGLIADYSINLNRIQGSDRVLSVDRHVVSPVTSRDPYFLTSLIRVFYENNEVDYYSSLPDTQYDTVSASES